MAERSQGLETTALWRAYREKMSSDEGRMAWVKNVYESSVAYLGDVRRIFKNYTLHDGVHVKNVLDAMGGLLGDWIGKLSEGEMELLILAACMHDLGMVYTDEEQEFAFSNERACQEFLREYGPELLGCEPEEWPEDMRQWYLRTLHPFRIPEVLQNEEWRELVEGWPIRVVPQKCVLAVCQAHGEEPRELPIHENLEYLAASDADPLFCTLLLRLADLLDFDDTRAPRVLYGYAAHQGKSREEWQKHQSSAGFVYPLSPSREELPYKARCKTPVIEHAVRHFLDWVDEELYQCAGLQRHCRPGWRQEFPFPRAVLRKEIESEGYLSGDFCLTMDQERILHLLMGENLYDNRDVFVRELLQNAIDATLLRGEMDASFIPEEARIDFWEWNDREGNVWFRIDDYGTGMTLGMLQRYFLKVGNSYYTSQEMKRDLQDHGQRKEFYGISRFGIGFLSCFLCGDFVEVSTLYFDPGKNRREGTSAGYAQGTSYGIRLQVTGLKGYYTIRSQAERHRTEDSFPRPDFFGKENQGFLERHGYRAKPGTSIAVRLDPGKLGVLNLQETVEKYLCGARMPVYYNHKRLGRTCGEAMKIVHGLAGERVYELSLKEKKKWDETFPAVRGNYPRLVQTMIPLDAGENRILPDLSGVLVKYEVRFERKLWWKSGKQNYTIAVQVLPPFDEEKSGFECWMRQEVIAQTEGMDGYVETGLDWCDLEKEFGQRETEKLKDKLFAADSCPKTEKELGEVWIPFEGHVELSAVWNAFLKDKEGRGIIFNLDEFGYESLNSIFDNRYMGKEACVYQGVIADRNISGGNSRGVHSMLLLLGGKWKPAAEISRSGITGLPLEPLVAIAGVADEHEMLGDMGFLLEWADWNNLALREWRAVRNSPVGRWLVRNKRDYAEEIMRKYREYTGTKEDRYSLSLLIRVNNEKQILYKYAMAYLQDHYSMAINYERGQVITFAPKEEKGDKGIYDHFPPMMFCKAASSRSRKYICHRTVFFRRGITEDHPFAAWLLDNSALLDRYFRRQFRQMVECLCQKDADDIIREYRMIREQLYSLSNHHGLDIKSMPQIGMEDFWEEEIR